MPAGKGTYGSKVGRPKKKVYGARGPAKQRKMKRAMGRAGARKKAGKGLKR